MRNITAWLLVALTGIGCSDNLTKSKSSNNTSSNNTSTNNQNNTTSTNNTSTNNAGTNNSTIVPVDGQVVLKITKAQQISGRSYSVNLQIANGLEKSIAVSPSFFRLGVGGLELTTVDSQKSTCPSDALVSAGASVACLLVFNQVDASPDRLIYVGAGDPVVATFTAIACESCGTQNCVDLQSSFEHCGSCNNVLSGDEVCTNGVPECAQDFRRTEGFCIPDDQSIGLSPLPLDSSQTCEQICDGTGKYCEGILGRGECAEDSPFGDLEKYPGANFCETTGTDVASFTNQFGCTFEAVFCTCY